ncbi:FAD-binding oxidoreductase [Streptomyces sp. MS1.HAVA.3]|uniref:FAD-binding oxidoreductase n=1 Tax=Streptomyces caledonius TaxID=3134107 RepID=A0ABU8TY01_9ACTN
MSLHRRQVLGSAAAAVLATAGAAARSPDYGALAHAIDGRVVLPVDREYAEARQLFQPRYDAVAPGAVAYPAHAADVAVCLDFARRSAAAVVPRGGGHGYAGWSTCAGGLVVDTGAMAEVSVEGDGVRIGAGARLADVHATLAGRGRSVPTGLCPSVGIAGLTLGGGLGPASRAYGTTADQLSSARVVTPDGRIREVSADRDPELFWALRGGGGGNFGVVTEFRFRTHPVGDCAFAELHWPGGDSADVLRGWQRWLAGLPDPFWSQVEFTVEADSGSGSRSGAGSGSRSGAGSESGPGSGAGAGAEAGATAPPAVRVVCLDGRGELERQLTRLSDLVGGPPRDSWIAVRSHADTVRALSGCLELSPAQCRLPGALPGRDPQGRLGRHSYAARSDFWAGEGLPDAAIGAVLDALRRYGSGVPRAASGWCSSTESAAAR